jgi:hypothetical protein
MAFATSSGVPSLPSGTLLAIDFRRSAPDGEQASRSFKPGVSVEPGLTAFTRIRRVLRSVGYRFDPSRTRKPGADCDP